MVLSVVAPDSEIDVVDVKPRKLSAQNFPEKKMKPAR